MKERIPFEDLKKKVVTAQLASEAIRDGMTIAVSGYAMAGYPKAVIEALAERKRGGEELSLNLISGANVPWVDETLGAEEIINRRAPMIASRTLASQANKGQIRYVEQQMNKMPRLLRSRALGEIDVAVVEACGFDEEGNLIPTSSAGMTHYLLDNAKEIVVEINLSQPEELMSLHDIYIPLAPPQTEPIPLIHCGQRIGASGIPVNRAKIRAIVETERPERMGPQPGSTELTDKIATHLFDFLEREYGDWEGHLPPVQTGFGSIANSVAEAFGKSDFKDLQFFCGGVTEPLLELLAQGKASVISTGGLGMSERVEEILKEIPDISEKLVIRNGDISNRGEVIERLGVIALNTGIEVDIYGNVNSSHIAGSRVVNGLGGGANFAQNSGLSVILIPSNAKNGAISNIVPMVSHQDMSEHDVDIVVTEFGLADLRGLDDCERAEAIINNCASPLYKDQLKQYFHEARDNCGGHHPQLPERAFEWYRRLKENKTMLERQDG